MRRNRWQTWLITMIWVAFLAVLNSCNNQAAPDVSHIPVTIEIERFDQFMFEKWDTADQGRSITDLYTAFPTFSSDFIVNVIGLPGFDPAIPDSAKALTFSEMKRFIRLTKPLYDSLSSRFSNIQHVEEELSQAFKYVRYYFPDYTIPKVISFLGPFDAPGIAITGDALGIGLQLYAGKNFSFYNSPQGIDLYPMYISRRFEPKYIPVNAMKAVIEDLFPGKTQGGSLIEQIIENGKQWYLLDKFLPVTPDSLKTGYTQQQLAWCEQNEGLIWNFLLQTNDIYTTEPMFIKTFIGESPTTEGMPSSAPGNIGQWIGWQIVKKYHVQVSGSEPATIMNLDAKQVFSRSKYRPK
ncbi:MAG: hypothetical protein WKF97_09980 [Chitinophagaceae bacterium]